MIVTISAEAESDLDEIAYFIAADKPLRAATFVEELVASCHGLVDHPERHPLTTYGQDLRRFPYRGYSIYYRVRAADIVIIHILHDALDHRRLLEG